jgi:hypothetical protein
MKFTQMLTAMSVAIGVGAGAALTLWPYSVVAEFLLDGAVLLGLGVFVAWIIGLFFGILGTLRQHITMICAGAALGAYVGISGTYFLGYLGNTYPASQAKLSAQSKEIESLTASIVALKNAQSQTTMKLSNSLAAANVELESTKSKLDDAKKALADPYSISTPAYNLNTSLKLQFDNLGRAREIESHNVKWSSMAVRQAVEIAPAPPPPPPPKPDCSNFAAYTDPTCVSLGSRNVLGLTGPTSPVVCPRPGPTYETSDLPLLVLTFPYPIRASGIELETYGDTPPAKNILSINEREAVIMFNNSLQKTVLGITVNQSNQ